MTVTPLQIAAAYVAPANGGTYHKPHLVQSADSNGKVTPYVDTSGTSADAQIRRTQSQGVAAKSARSK